MLDVIDGGASPLPSGYGSASSDCSLPDPPLDDGGRCEAGALERKECGPLARDEFAFREERGVTLLERLTHDCCDCDGA